MFPFLSPSPPICKGERHEDLTFRAWKPKCSNTEPISVHWEVKALKRHLVCHGWLWAHGAPFLPAWSTPFALQGVSAPVPLGLAILFLESALDVFTETRRAMPVGASCPQVLTRPLPSWTQFLWRGG